MDNEVRWYFVSCEGYSGFLEMSPTEAAKARTEYEDDVIEMNPPTDLVGWRTIILPINIFHKMVGLDSIEN